ncbi:cupin domain-containing protein [Natranaeroarchaeum sulfidigenes]|uniref:Cupin domain containing protein n=1 Tax=Natranaeroarchaeum sulfidigenes TaxID=2784880 RepID=A0A897N0V3_9EURY|nr:cupin domain-containing protein [Natranaeroarchaeum sulfidigenes]QSG04305.1 Cupin domain containing protein [Natranaeroarchaeum sulfidigenes]
MEKVRIDDVENELSPLGVHSVRKPVSDTLGTTDFAMNYFELESGESFSGGLHAHHDQEEVFYIEAGVATFDVGLDREPVEVGAGELIRFPPGEFQEGYNDGDERVIGWALGAPGATHDWDALQSRLYCPACEAETTQETRLVDDEFQFTCTECGAELP